MLKTNGMRIYAANNRNEKVIDDNGKANRMTFYRANNGREVEVGKKCPIVWFISCIIWQIARRARFSESHGELEMYRKWRRKDARKVAERYTKENVMEERERER